MARAPKSPAKRAPKAATVLPAVDQPPANPERGEHKLTLAGTVFVLRPSHAAIVAIEGVTEKSLMELTRLGNIGGLPVEMLGTIAAELIRAGGKPVNGERIGEMILEEGLPGCTARITMCLLDAATGGRDTEGNAKPTLAAGT